MECDTTRREGSGFVEASRLEVNSGGEVDSHAEDFWWSANSEVGRVSRQCVRERASEGERKRETGRDRKQANGVKENGERERLSER